MVMLDTGSDALFRHDSEQWQTVAPLMLTHLLNILHNMDPNHDDLFLLLRIFRDYRRLFTDFWKVKEKVFYNSL
jgi:hypothetical protein